MSYNPNSGTGIAQSLIDAKGDLIAGTADNTAARLAVGSDGTFLKANSAQSTGLEWATGSGGIGAVLFDSTLGADTATIDTGAAGIAGGYKTLEIVIYGRTDEAVTTSAAALTFNNDTGANYGRQYVGGANASAVAGNSLTDTGILIVLPGSSCAASIFGSWHFTVPAYTQTTAYKACGGTGGAVDTTAANCAFYAFGGIWRSTSAITRAAITPTTAGKKLLAGSRLTIYGF